jgi:hypothetical protein
MRGTAADDEALTDMLDRLFASPWFEHPTLPVEQRENGQIGFELRVNYLPESPRAAAQTHAVATPAPERPAPARPAATEGAP